LDSLRWLRCGACNGYSFRKLKQLKREV